MEAIRQTIVDVDLTKKLHRVFSGVLLAKQDKLANRMGANVFQDGAAVNLSGYTVKGYFIRNGTETIVIEDGAIIGNQAYVELPGNCYFYDGSYTLTIKLCQGGQELALVIFDGQVGNTITDAIVENENVINAQDFVQMDWLNRVETAAETAFQQANNAAEYAAQAQAIKDSIPTDYADMVEDVGNLSEAIDTLESKTGLKYTNDIQTTKLYDYLEAFVADDVTQNADGKVYKSDGSLASTSGSTSYRVNVKPGDVYLITTRLSNYYIVLFAGNAVHKAYSITEIGEEITANGNGEYNASTKRIYDWRLTIPDGVDSIGVTAATYATYNSTLYKEEDVVEYINVTDVKEKADAAHEHVVMPVTTMPTYLQNVLGYKPLGALSKPYICLSTDDGREGLIHQTIEMVVDVAHVPVTFCIHSKADIFYAQKRKKYTLAQVAEKINGAIANEDCELALHDNKIWADMSESKKTPYTEETLHQFVQDEKAFIANPFEQDTNTELGVSWEYKSASAPEHATDAVVSVVMGGEFGVLRSGDTSMGLIKNIYDYKCLGARSNLYCLSCKNVNSGMYNTLEKAKAAVDYAIAHNLVLPIFWHEAIMASATEESNDNEHITDEQINTILLPMIAYAKEKGVEFVTLSQIPYLE